MKHSDPKQPAPHDLDPLLEDYFKSARAAAPLPDAAFLQSVMDQIPQGNAVDTGVPRADRVPDVVPWWRQIFAELGGWPTLTGLATAGIVGVWVGLTGDSILGLSLDQFQTASDFADPFIGSDLSYIEG